MTVAFSPADGAIFFRLLLAHLLTDFVLQPTVWVQHKRADRHRSPYLYWHGLVALLTTYALLGDYRNPWPALVVGVSHTGIDALKLHFDRHNRLRWFVGDQAAHVGVLVLVWLTYTENWGRLTRVGEAVFSELTFLTVLTGYLICTTPLSFLIGIATRKWQRQLNPPEGESLADAGKWIGISERLLIFTFVLVGQYEAIGFLIAAKSLLRLREGSRAPLQSEYVLVGTLLSYTLAIGIGLLVKLTLTT